MSDFVALEKRLAGVNIIEALQAAQRLYGWISAEAMEFISEKLRAPLADVIGAATFYAQFRLAPVGKNVITVCQGTACHVNGADGVMSALEGALGVKDGQTTGDGRFTLQTAACLGCCSLSPVMTINEETFGNVTGESAYGIVANNFMSA